MDEVTIEKIIKEKLIGKEFVDTEFHNGDYGDGSGNYDPRGWTITDVNFGITEGDHDPCIYITFDQEDDYGQFYVYLNDVIKLK